MTQAQEHLQAFKKTLGQFANPIPRQVDTDESMIVHIDRVIDALKAIRPKRKRQAKPGMDRMRRDDDDLNRSDEEGDS